MKTILRKVVTPVKPAIAACMRAIVHACCKNTLNTLMLLGAGTSTALLLTISCSTMDDSMVIPTLIPGATYVENDACAECHDVEAETFKGTAHGMRFIKNGAQTKEGCQSCHGPGSKHVESGGEKSLIVKGNEAMCYTCHQRVRSEFALQYTHPVASGRMGCNDCHSVHSKEQAGTKLVSNDTCFKCHQEQRGPWAFEHEPVEHDGCSTCHNPHGSINSRMLVERDYNLCIKCHYSTQFQKVGHYAHRRAINPQGVDPSGKMSTCTGCHRGVHGSNFSKELRTQ
jgi:predicted CXXCH cytochrome family protein